MKLRAGRKNAHTLYLQMGQEPDDTDPCLGMFVDPGVAVLIAESVNRDDETVRREMFLRMRIS